MTSEGSYIHTQ